MVLSVFPAGLFSGYDGMHAESRARREYAASLEEARTMLKTYGKGLEVSLYSAEGDPEEAIVATAESEQVDIILITPRYRRVMNKTSIPIAVVPGTLLLPVDSSREALSIVEQVAGESRESGSAVVVLGIIPVHLYSRSEAQELETVHQRTVATLDRVSAALRERGVNVRTMVRSGYPDDEIIRAASEVSASTIIFSGGGITPSELRKAAHVLMTDRERTRFPLLFVPQAGSA